MRRPGYGDAQACCWGLPAAEVAADAAVEFRIRLVTTSTVEVGTSPTGDTGAGRRPRESGPSRRSRSPDVGELEPLPVDLTEPHGDVDDDNGCPAAHDVPRARSSHVGVVVDRDGAGDKRSLTIRRVVCNTLPGCRPPNRSVRHPQSATATTGPGDEF